MKDSGSDFCLSANGRKLLLLETIFAKEAKNRRDCGGNLLGCSIRGIRRIAVRTKWQSGSDESPACV